MSEMEFDGILLMLIIVGLLLLGLVLGDWAFEFAYDHSVWFRNKVNKWYEGLPNYDDEDEEGEGFYGKI